MFRLFCEVLLWSVLTTLGQALYPELIVAAAVALQTAGLLCARALTLIKLDTAPDIIRAYGALPKNS